MSLLSAEGVLPTPRARVNTMRCTGCTQGSDPSHLEGKDVLIPVTHTPASECTALDRGWKDRSLPSRAFSTVANLLSITSLKVSCGANESRAKLSYSSSVLDVAQGTLFSPSYISSSTLLPLFFFVPGRQGQQKPPGQAEPGT